MGDQRQGLTPASLVTYECQLKLILASQQLDLSSHPRLRDFAAHAFRSGYLAEDAALIIKATFAAIDRINLKPSDRAIAQTAALDELAGNWDEAARRRPKH
jgi:hypothetical protein